MELKLNGITRIVFLIGDYAIKIPNFTCQHDHFLQGCYANWSERKYTKSWNGYNELYDKIAPTLFSTWFGLLSIQRRCHPFPTDLNEHEVKMFENLTTDIKKENFGFLNGKMVCLDYP